MVDAEHVGERQRATHSLDPPPISGAGQLVPVVERVPPELPASAERVGRRTRDRLVERQEELGMGRVVAATGGDVDRQVTDDPDSAFRGVGPEGAPFPREAHLLLERAVPRERGPVVQPCALARPEPAGLAGADRRVGIGEQADPACEGRGRRVRRAERVRRVERQHLPPARSGRLEPVDERVRVGPEPAAGKRRGVKLDSE